MNHSPTQPKSALGVLLVLAVATIFVVVIVNRLSSAVLTRATPTTAPTCHNTAGVVTHQVVIQSNRVQPEHTDAHLCDRLIITNVDAVSRELAFGRHDAHVAYDGISEKMLAQNQDVTVTLEQLGEFRFHDHLQDEVQGTFSVSVGH